MNKKEIGYINKIYDALYDLNSRARCDLFNLEKDKIEDVMNELGYEVKINRYDKAVFVRKK